ncbi:Periplasmic thiol:disulfide interchange protein DsbA [hydrothermal vent metagenome]|uniref:Periplasmic thiol:disulfide interchange protein DsbA n=1 Tax=hydrothermal vent metagenome TaxID=652676 RepID=A0A3B0WUW6_9ZZZZ
MKKITLMLSIMFIWGCSQAHDQEVVEEAKAAAKEVVTEQVEAVKVEAMDQAKELASDTISAATNDAVSEAKEAESAAYQAGIHYQVINPAYETETDSEVVVYEFFGYTCPHCATFEPYMKKLEAELPEKAKLVRVPVVFGKQWEPFAQAYYTFEAMGITDQAHEPMFQAIHQHKKQFRSIDEIAVWAASSFGIDKEEFLSTAKSFMIDGQVRKGMQMLEAMGVTSTPTLVTNGKFVPNSKALKTRNDIIEVTKFLVNQELDAMKP